VSVTAVPHKYLVETRQPPIKCECRLSRFYTYGHVIWEDKMESMAINVTSHTHILTSSSLRYRYLDFALMTKDKSDKKKKRVSDVAPAAVEKDVEMAETKVSNDYCFRQREIMQG
jgi:hypothetical protein